MSFRNRRRSSSHNSNLHSSIRRRSSIANAELEQVQNLLQKRKPISASFVIFILSSAPIFIFSYQIILSNKDFIKKIFITEYNLGDVLVQLKTVLLNPTPWLTTLLIIQFQLLFLWNLPGEEHNIVTISGYKFRTKHNSFDSCVLICLLYLFGASIGLYDGDIIYKHWVGIMFVLSLLSIFIQIYLFTFYEPNCLGESNIINNLEQNIFSEIYLGRYLQPIIFEIDVKVFITNRIAFTLWPLYVISSLYNQYKCFRILSGSLVTCAVLQLFYIARRHWFEYITRNLDNANDRMGFYRTWGALVFLPTLYFTPITLLSQTESNVSSNALCISLFIIGILFQCLNTDIDLQKYKFRIANGVWKIGNKDAFYIEAKFRKENGELGTELLLGSGYWGKARHLNYTTEFLTFLTWTLPTKFESIATYFPVIFLVILLFGRMQRDEIRCLVKYTYHWLQYVARVPYLIIPGVV